MNFTRYEIATIRKFLFWAKDEWFDPSGEGITGFDDDGFLVTEFRAESGYEGCAELEREERLIPLLAMTDPDEYERQRIAEEKAEQARQAEASRQYAEFRIAQERAQYEALKRKFEGSSL